VTPHKENAAIVVAAGRGTRARGEMPKQYRLLGGRSVLARSLAAYLDHPGIHRVQPVIHPDDLPRYEAIATTIASAKLLAPVFGGDSRQQSVLAGLEALRAHAPRTVLIHDAARPLVTPEIISRALKALEDVPACLAALPVADTLKVESDGHVGRTLDRRGLWRAQTPQGFHFDAILEAHRAAEAERAADFTDDASIAEWRGLPVALVMGGERNIKLTTPEDFDMAERLVAGVPSLPREIRHGTGFDVHAFEPGDHVMLCGVKVPHSEALKGHSDADVGLHALTDAVLGAIGAGDIGDHFPPSDARWRGAESGQFLRHAAGLVAERGGRIVHLDVTLICEIPKIGPHKEAMRLAVAALLGLDAGRVSVKATTTEGLGFTGRREGIAAMASATVDLPGGDPDA
jgi:2-C-methyl-D-erythritol 4-phosphate cytidylyltransferase / 2-C-methyl-D-erythritol 2,4-cyclodiphosphate synthase